MREERRIVGEGEGEGEERRGEERSGGEENCEGGPMNNVWGAPTFALGGAAPFPRMPPALSAAAFRPPTAVVLPTRDRWECGRTAAGKKGFVPRLRRAGGAEAEAEEREGQWGEEE